MFEERLHKVCDWLLKILVCKFIGHQWRFVGWLGYSLEHDYFEQYLFCFRCGHQQKLFEKEPNYD